MRKLKAEQRDTKRKKRGYVVRGRSIFNLVRLRNERFVELTGGRIKAIADGFKARR